MSRPPGRPSPRKDAARRILEVLASLDAVLAEADVAAIEDWARALGRCLGAGRYASETIRRELAKAVPGL